MNTFRGRFSLLERTGLVVGAFFLAGGALRGQSFNVIYAFVNSNGAGAYPEAGLIQGADGNFYGTTFYGGLPGFGNVFRLDAAAHEQTIHAFNGDGGGPSGKLVQMPDGFFYGTTERGGASNLGTVFRIDTSGNLTTLHSFCAGVCGEGNNPYGGLYPGNDGYLYGTTADGGTGNCGYGCGTIFKIDTAGNLTTIHSFDGSDGYYPYAGLVQASDGNFYGTATQGGVSGLGTVFKIDSTGNFTLLHSFDGTTDGNYPYAELVQASDGYLYGATSEGGPGFFGTIYRIDTAGNLTTLYSFSNADGASPMVGLIQASDGYLYGSTYAGGSFGDGTLFQMDLSGNVISLHSFDGNDGKNPRGTLILASDGGLYGTTYEGGGSNTGVVFELFPCSFLPPYVSVARCLAPNTSGFVASVQANTGNSFVWSITGGTIDAGQGTYTIDFTSGGPGTLIMLQVVVTDPTNCSGKATQTMEVDFTDVPASNPFHAFICAVARNGISAGCGAGNFCPADVVLRSQMAVFLVQGEHGLAYTPPASDCATYPFTDVSCPSPFADYILQLFNEGVTAGCGTNPLTYCPGDSVSRAGMAVFLLVAQHGFGYAPPACAGIFADVSCPGPFTNWIEQLYNEAATGGCNTNPLRYCPGNSVTRAQMAVFLTVTFALP